MKLFSNSVGFLVLCVSIFYITNAHAVMVQLDGAGVSLDGSGGGGGGGAGGCTPLTTIQIGALAPALGDCVYDTDLKKEQYYNGTVFIDSVDVSLAQTIINKVIDAASNTISNIGSAEIANDSIVNADVNSAASIVYSKLSFSDNIVAGDIATGAVASTEILDDSIVNADINSAAAIAVTKLATFTSAELATQLTNETGTGLAVFNTAPSLAGLTVTGASSIAAPTIGTPTFTTIQDNLNVFHSSGVTSWDGLTDDADGTITVGAGTGLIRATDSVLVDIAFLDWALEAGVNVALVDNDLSYIYVEYNGGTPQVIATTTERADLNTNILLATVYREGTSVHMTEVEHIRISDHAGLMIKRTKDLMPFAHVSGGTIGETGTRNITISAGSFWHGLNEYTTSAADTSVADTFTYYYQDGGGAFTSVLSGTQIDNLQYDDGSGTLATLGNSRYGVHWVFKGVSSNTYVVYGRGSYTLADAVDTSVPANLPPHFENHARIYGRIIIGKSDATFTDITGAFASPFEGGVASSHNDLSGIQGGTTADYYHLLNADYVELIDVNAQLAALHTDGSPSFATVTAALTGNASTATALAANGANCAADTYPLGVDASGAVESCGTINSAAITDLAILNADINAAAAIAITKLATFTSAQLATQLTDETGTGSVVFSTSPTIATPSFTGSLNFGESVAGGNPAANTWDIYVDADGVVRKQDEGGNVARITPVHMAYDMVFDYPQGDADFVYDDHTVWSSGNNATVMGGGTISNAVDVNFSNSVVMDLERASAWKYATGTGSTNLNDYFCSPVVTIPQGVQDNGSGKQDILFKFWYWSNITKNIQLKAYCVGDTAEVTHLNQTPMLEDTDLLYGDGDNTKDADEGTLYNNDNGIVFQFDKTCDTVRMCFHVTEELDDGETMYFDKLTAGVMPTNRIETAGESEVYQVIGGGDDATTNTAQITFLAGTVRKNTISNLGTVSDVDADGWSFTASKKVSVHIAATLFHSSSLGIGFGYTLNASTLTTVFDSVPASEQASTGFVERTNTTTNIDVSGSAKIEMNPNDVLRVTKGSMASGVFEDNARTSMYMTATPMRNKAIAISGSQHTAGLKSRLTWQATTNCAWQVSSTSWTSFSADADCDDNARYKLGNTTSNKDAANSDGQIPQISFSGLDAGVYTISYDGSLATSSAQLCAYRFYDGSNNPEHGEGTLYESSGSLRSNTFKTVYYYDGKQGATTFTAQAKSVGGVAACHFGAATNQLSITVEYQPLGTLTGKNLIYSVPTIDIGGDYYVVARGNAGTALTANVTNIDFTEVKDDNNLWDGDTFTAPENVKVSASLCTKYTTSNSAFIYAYVNTVQVDMIFAGASYDYKCGSYEVTLKTGQTLSFRTGQGVTLSNDTVRHTIGIKALRDFGSTSMAHIISQPVALLGAVYSSATSGGATSANTVHNRVLNTVIYDEGTGVSLTGAGSSGTNGTNDQFTVEAGTNLIECWGVTNDSTTGRVQSFIYDVTNSTYKADGVSLRGTADTNFMSYVFYLSVTGTDTEYELRTWTEQGEASFGLGRASDNHASNPQAAELYSTCKITRKR